jgi:hypothetical protein
VLAASSRGDVVVLAVAVAVAAGSVLASIAVVGALAGVALRWGSSSLGAVAGAQAVLGPAGWTGGAAAVASAWVGAAAVVLAAPTDAVPGLPSWLAPFATAVPFGLVAALVAVGPGPGGALGLRVVASVVATGAVVAVGRARAPRVEAARLAGAVAFGAAALVLEGFAA